MRRFLGANGVLASAGSMLSAIERGAFSDRPACVASSRATSRTLRPMGPSVLSWLIHTSCTGAIGTRPWLGRKPKQLAQAAGLRRLPMKSEPSATGSRRSASAAAPPPLLPPAERAGS